MSRQYKAIILNDYQENPYAEWVKIGRKRIETRMKRKFHYRGDIVICCGKTNSVTENAGKALCIVEIWKGRKMQPKDEQDACIEYHDDRQCLLLRNWRHFSEDFEFSTHKIAGTYQGLFTIQIPDHIQIIPCPGIAPCEEEPETVQAKLF